MQLRGFLSLVGLGGGVSLHTSHEAVSACRPFTDTLPVQHAVLPHYSRTPTLTKKDTTATQEHLNDEKPPPITPQTSLEVAAPSMSRDKDKWRGVEEERFSRSD